MIVVGVTGGIASGKSTVTAILKNLGAPIFDADESSRNATKKGSKGLVKIIEVFGKEFLTKAEELDRAKMAELCFSDKAAKKKLEAIIHKIVWNDASDFLKENESNGTKVVVLDIPLLIEVGWHENVDLVWLVAVDKKVQIERAMSRDAMTRAEVEARINSQMSLEEKKKYADLVIDNNGSNEDIITKVKTAWEHLQENS